MFIGFQEHNFLELEQEKKAQKEAFLYIYSICSESFYIKHSILKQRKRPA